MTQAIIFDLDSCLAAAVEVGEPLSALAIAAIAGFGGVRVRGNRLVRSLAPPTWGEHATRPIRGRNFTDPEIARRCGSFLQHFVRAEVGEIHHCRSVAAGVRRGRQDSLDGHEPLWRRGHDPDSDCGRGRVLARHFPDTAQANVDLRGGP